jgi:hypothetical protein
MKCQHPADQVTFDILEGDWPEHSVRWCRICGAYRVDYGDGRLSAWRERFETPAGLIPLSQSRQALIKEWAADDRLWTTQETVALNLETFARAILKVEQ